LILNKTLKDLDVVINDHDPEIDTSINNGVWDRLDKMAMEVEALSAMPPQEVSVQEAARVLINDTQANSVMVEAAKGEVSTIFDLQLYTALRALSEEPE
jgi:hypothetical protein